MPRGKPKSAKQKIRDKADTLMSLAVRRIGYCERCGALDRLQHHHVVEKGRSNFLRYDFKNALCLCSGCHKWWHTAGTIKTSHWFKTTFGEERYNYLASHTETKVVTNMGFYQDAIDRIKNYEQTKNI